MFDNIGGKIKTLAVIIAIVGIVGSFVTGCVFLEESVGIGLLIMVGGALLSWIGSFFMYGFGQLIENSDDIKENSDQILSILNRKKQPGTSEYSHNDISVIDTSSESDKEQQNTVNPKNDNGNNTTFSKKEQANSNEIEPNMNLSVYDFDFAVKNQKYYIVHFGQCSCCRTENQYVALCSFVQNGENTMKIICKNCFIHKNAKLELK